MEQGLSQGTANDILQDRRGFMWFSTQDGLNRWDGYEMKVYKHQPFDSTSLSSGWLFGMDEDDSGNLWLASMGGLNELNPISESVEYWRHDENDSTSIVADELQDVFVASDGMIWIATRVGLDRMDPDKPGVFKHYRSVPGDPTSLSDPDVTWVSEDSRGTIWAGGPNGLNRLDDQEQGIFAQFFVDPDEQGCALGRGRDPRLRVAGFLERPEEPGVLWFGSERGLIRFDTDNSEIKEFNPDPDAACFSVLTPAQDPLNPGVLWMTLLTEGLGRFDIRNESFQIFANDPDNASSLPAGLALKVFVDRSGIIWVGSVPSGVSYFDPASIGVGLYREVTGNPNTLGGGLVTSVAQSRDGILWVGGSSSFAGWTLTELDRTNGTARHYRHDPNDPTSLRSGRYWSALAAAPSGEIWLGGEFEGVDRLNRETGRFSHFLPNPDDPESIAVGRASVLLADQSGSLWIGQRGVISRMNFDEPGRFVRYEHDPDDPATPTAGLVRGLSENRAGFIWIAQEGAAARLDPITGKVTRYTHDPDNPNSLASTTVSYAAERRVETGVVWVLTYEGGLDRVDLETGDVRNFSERDGLSNNGTYGFLEDDQGRLWISTNRGISRFDPDTETFRNYGLEVGLQGFEFNSGAYHRGPYGEFFFGGQNGLNSFFPNELNENSKPPQVTLVDLKLFNESIAKTGAVELEESLDRTDQITLRHDQSDIEFDFAAFHYADPGSNEYAYRLEGWNDDWVFTGNKRSASFTNLDPGEYTFRVKAANSDGVWNEEGTSIRIVVEPPFWATWWFRILGLLAFAGVILGGYRVRTSQLESRARELEGEVSARTSQLKASNDQLEQSHSIVEAINQETSFRRLLTIILEESRVIPGVEKATAVVYMPDEGVFRVRASSGWDVAAMSDITLTDRQARQRYVAKSEEVATDIFVAKNVADRTGSGSERMAEFGKVASFLVLRINVDDEVMGYLVFDNLTDPDAFDQRDVEFLERLRAHIQSAFIKTRILEDLQGTLNDLQSTQDRLIQSEKMASLGELTAGIAHEIKNPLNFVNNFAEIAVELVEEAAEAAESDSPERVAEILAELKENAERIDHHAKRADGIVENMMQHASGSGSVEPTDINALLEEYVALSYHGFQAKHDDFEITIEKNLDDSIRKLEVNPQELGKVFQNLLTNAFDALRDNGEWRVESGELPTVTVSTSKTEGSGPGASNAVEIRISDNGPGMPEDVKAKIFEPFFTTKPTGSGTGLGLSMSYDIVTKGHNGSLEVESVEGEGATFIVRLPA